jgi:hypothetical protein
MATVKISELPAILGANTATTDVLPIVDVSGNITNKITREEFFSNIGNMSGVGTITGATTLSLLTTTTSALSLDSGTTGAINIGTNANAKTITIGNSTGATSIVLNSGTGAINIGTNAIARTITIGNTTGASALTLEAGTGALNIGTGAFAKTITIGNGTGATSVVLNAGTGAINIGTNAIARTTTIGNATGGSTVAINSGTGDIILNGANANSVGISTTSPYSKLDIVQATAGYGGWKYGASLNATDFPALRFLATTGNTGSIIAHEAGATVFLTGTTATAAGSERMRITSAGDVGIGTTSPTADLSVGSATSTSGDVHLRTTKTTFELTPSNSDAGGMDINVGFVAGGQGPLKFSIGGTERMRITSAGDVGIGTASPTDLVQLVGGNILIGTDSGDPFNSQSRVRIQGAGSEYIQIKGDGTGSLGLLFGDATDNFLAGILSDQSAGNNLTFHAGNAERMRIDTSGNLGLGVTPSAWGGGFTGFQLRNSLSLWGASGTSAYYSNNAFYDGSSRKYIFTGAAAEYEQGAGTHAWKIAPSGTAGNAITFTQAMTLDASGNLGVGVTSPSKKLHLAGTAGSSAILLAKTDSGASTLGQIGFSTVNGTVAGIDATAVTDSNNGALRFWTTGGSPQSDVTSLSERARITSDGFVGIGSTAPVVSLHVVGDTMTTGVVYKNQPAEASKAAAATLTIAELENGLIRYTGAAATLTLPTGTNIETGTPNTFPVNMSFDFSVINTGTGTATLGTATGLTLIGAMGVAINTTGVFRVRKTATNAFTVYRVG